MKPLKPITSTLLIACLLAPLGAYATNGMNLEAYGPIAMGAGGTSMAYDNGTAAVINNPATLGLMEDGTRRMDVALGLLGPDIDSSAAGMTATSSADAFYMPAIGWATHQGQYTYGFGVFGQGGMGTEYGSSSWMADPSMGVNTALTQGLVNRSEVSFGRLMFPLTYQANDKLIIGGTIDFVWAGMDLKMAMSEGQFVDMADVSKQTIGTASGSLVSSFGGMYIPFGGATIATLHHAYFDFSNSSDFTGEADGTGYAGKLGLVYQLDPKTAIGFTYHSKTDVDDLKTGNATLSMDVNADFGSGFQDYDIPVTGTMTIRDFQWPEIYALGIAYQASDKLLITADAKHIGWSDVMATFKMQFVADSTQANPLAGGFASQVLNAQLFQYWDDQTVLQAGLAYDYNDRIVLRGGFNIADNPIPNQYINALFPATIEEHYMAGIGYALEDNNEINFALSYAPDVTVTNPGNGSTIPPVTTSHSQLSWQLMYSHEY